MKASLRQVTKYLGYYFNGIQKQSKIYVVSTDCLQIPINGGPSKVSAQQDEKYEPAVEPSEAEILEAVDQEMKTSSSFKLEPAMPEQSLKTKKKKKMVRFKLQKDVGGSRRTRGDSRRGPVRIRLVVTQKELQRILRYENDRRHTSLEQLLSDMKLRGSGISEVGEDDGAINPWKPTLESIPEDRSMK